MKIRKNEKQKPNRTIFNRTAALLISALLIVSSLLASCGGNENGSTATTAPQTENRTTTSSAGNETVTTAVSGTIKVPNVLGMTEEEAVSLLEGMGFEVKVTHQGSNDYAKGLVFKTDRNEGDELKAGDRVFIYVSRGEASSVDTPKVDPLVASRGEKEVGANKDYAPLNYEVMKAVWLSQYDMSSIYCSGTLQRNEDDFTKLVKTVMKNVKSIGCNTVIIQLRPNADSVYPSKYYPYSKYSVGSYGLYADYDPLEIMIKEAHSLDLSVQGWVNPMRGFDTGSIKVINASYPMKQWYSDPEKNGKYIYAFNGTYYLNPAYQEVRDLIVNGAAEIVRYYDIDGIHMDDYFYPADIPEAFDRDAFEESDLGSLRTFRKENLCLLISEMYEAIKKENPNVIYGISPAGNMGMVRNSCMLDIDTILAANGYVDYICPQLYWGFEGSNGGFATLYDQWSALIKTNGINMIAGISYGNALNPTDTEWIRNKDVIKRCIEYIKSKPQFAGYSLFCYQYLFNPTTGEKNAATLEEAENMITVAKSILDKKITY